MLAGGEPKIRVKNGLVTHGIEVELVFFSSFLHLSIYNRAVFRLVLNKIISNR